MHQTVFASASPCHVHVGCCLFVVIFGDRERERERERERQRDRERERESHDSDESVSPSSVAFVIGIVMKQEVVFLTVEHRVDIEYDVIVNMIVCMQQSCGHPAFLSLLL